MPRGRVPKNYSGQKFGRVLVLQDSRYEMVGVFKKRFVLGVCDCGVSKEFSLYCLTKGVTKSCGCFYREVHSEKMRELVNGGPPAKLTHGHSRSKKPSRTYSSWCSMHQRCRNPNADQWRYYGGRGIRVCERWFSFENFLADMGERPAKMTIDRIDPDGDYEPSNCRWADSATQVANRRKLK